MADLISILVDLGLSKDPRCRAAREDLSATSLLVIETTHQETLAEAEVDTEGTETNHTMTTTTEEAEYVCFQKMDTTKS